MTDGQIEAIAISPSLFFKKSVGIIIFISDYQVLSLLDKFKVTSEHVLIIGHCPLM